VSVDVRRGDAPPGEDVGVGIVVSGAQQPGEPGDTYDHERRGGNEVQGGNPDTSREIVIPSGQGHAHERSPATRERSPVTRVPAPDVSQKIPCCSTNLSHKTPCHPSPQKQIGTPAQLREPTRTPLLYSRPVTRSPRKTPEGAKMEDGGENAVMFLWGSRATGPGRPPFLRREGATSLQGAHSMRFQPAFGSRHGTKRPISVRAADSANRKPRYPLLNAASGRSGCRPEFALSACRIYWAHAALDCRRSYSVFLPLQFDWPQIGALTGPPDCLGAPVGGCSGPATLSGRVLDGGERRPRGTCKGRFWVT